MPNQRDYLTHKPTNNLKLWSLPLALILLTEIGAIAQAQIVPDNTLPNNSIVAPDGNMIEITGGSTTGGNLFHSFAEFSVPDGQTAYFDHGTTINNIISRVTGNGISNIEGLIKANDTANLFLINPQGIVFGESAALDIGGSFVATTADSLKFSDDLEFSATSPQSPLLTVNIPVGLQFGRDSQDITVKGTGHNAFFDFDTFTIDRFERNLGLGVSTGNTLALVGRNILLEGGNLTARGGNIALGSIAESGTVELAPHDLGFSLDYGELSGAAIALSDQASIDVSGNGSGNIQIQGESLNLTDGSAIFAETEGDATGGLSTIKANQVNILGNDPDETIPSSIWSDVYLGATGDGGSVQIDTESLLLEDGGQVNVNTFGEGNAGNLTVKATDIEVIGESPVFGDFISGLFAQADIFLTGKGGNILIDTASLLVQDGAQINASTFGDGDAGNLTILADDVQLVGGSQNGSSGLFAKADYVEGFDGTGNGGNLDLTTNNLLVSDGAQITTSSSNIGNAGNLTITAQNIELAGGSESAASSLSVFTEFSGNGGNLNLNTDNLLVKDGAQIIANTFDEGDAGNLSITAQNIELTGTSEAGVASGLFSIAEASSIGNGGDISIATEQLVISDGALLTAVTSRQGNGGNIGITTGQLQVSQGGQIAVTTFASGDGGTLDLTADNIELDGFSEVASSGLFSSALDGDGNGGNINLKSDRLSIQNGATINGGNFPSRNSDRLAGTGKTGSINIDVDTLELDSSTVAEFSNITASANTQAGGDITLNVNNDAVVSNGSEITATTQGDGNGGNINFSAGELSLNNQGKVAVDSTGSGNAGDIAIAARSLNLNQGQVTATATAAGGGEISLITDSLFLQDNSLISTSVLESDGGGGNITINNTDFIVGENNSAIKADAVFGDGGKIQIDTTALFFDGTSEITASSQFGVDGVVEINDLESQKKLSTLQLANNVTPPLAVVTSNCPVSKNNTFAITGKGGMPQNPGQYLRGQAVWQDSRIPAISNTNTMSPYGTPVGLVEAQGWQINPSGKLELIAQTSLSDRWGHNEQCSATLTD